MRGGNSESQAMERYFEDKANIFRHQNKSDYLVVSCEMAHSIVKKYPLLQSEIVAVKSKDLQDNLVLKIPGEHNRENIILGCTTLKILGLSEEEVKESAESFKGIPGRLELIKEKKGIKIYNDTTSTTPASAVVALESLGDADKKNIVLIMGGADKQIDMTKLINILPKYCHTIVLLPGTGTDTVKEKIKKDNFNVVEVSTLAEAVKSAMNVAQTGDVVLLSPGFASFGLFKNEFDRGDQFDVLVKKL
jgi:UDP-N-acetylmuramoylalanine--D-glutamate ligase